MIAMLRNNPPDIVYSSFFKPFFQGAIPQFQRYTEMKNIVLTDPEAPEKSIRNFFASALRDLREAGHAD